MSAANTLADQRRADRAAADAQRAADLPDFIRHAQRMGADFAVRVTTAAQLAAVLETIGGHNNYDAHAAARILGPFVAESMGCEVKQWCGGPSIHFTVPFWTHQKISASADGFGMGTPLADVDRRAFAQRIIDAGRSLHADEISADQHPRDERVWNATGTHPYEIRLWWD